MELRLEIIEKELSLLSPEVRRSKEKLTSLLSQEFLEIGASGRTFRLDEVLSELPEESNYSAHAQDFEFRALSEDLVQLIYRSSSSRGGDGERRFAKRTSLWRRENGAWKMVYHQGTPVAPFESSEAAG